MFRYYRDKLSIAKTKEIRRNHFMRYDLIVIGGGIAGMNAALAAKDKGCSVY